MTSRRSPPDGHRVTVVLLALLLVALGLLDHPALGQEPATTTPEATTSSTGLAPVIDGDLEGDLEGDTEGDGGSPRVFVLLSLVGATAAVSIMAVRWFRTRPDTRPDRTSRPRERSLR